MSTNYYKSKNKSFEFIYTKNSTASYNEHNHVSVYVIGIILEGKVMLKRNSSELVCQTEDLFIIPPYETHAVCSFERSYSMLTICIHKKFFENTDLTEGINILKNIGEQFVTDKIITENHISAFTVALEAVYQITSEYKKQVSEYVHTARNRIVNQPEEDLKIADLADCIFISKYYFIKKFKEEVGLTPHNFHIQNRIRKSQHLLEEGMSIIEVAVAMGFYDQSHFIKYFKKIVGITPSEYIISVKKM